MSISYTLDSLNSLAAQSPDRNPPQAFHIQGAQTPGDGGGGPFFWDSVSTAPHDGATVINPGLGSDPGRWLRVYEDGFYHASWWGVNASNLDNSTGLQNAFNAVRGHFRAGGVGGTLRLPPGVLKHSQPLDLNDAYHITIEGSAHYQDNQDSSGTTLQYTGGSPVAVHALSAHTFAIKRICFCPSPGFGGVILAFGHSTTQGGDTINVLIEECGFEGGFNTPSDPVSNTIGIWFAYTIQATIRDCWIIDCRYGVLGVSRSNVTPFPPGPIPGSSEAVGSSGYSAGIQILTSQFGGAPIYNPHFGWTIDGAQVEGPGTETWVGGYFIDGDSAFLSINLIIRGCVMGDGQSANPWINLSTPVCPLIQGCGFYSGQNSVVLNNAYAPTFQSNYFAGGPVVFEGTIFTPNFAGGNRGLSVTNPEKGGFGGSNNCFSAGNYPDVAGCPPTEISDMRGVRIGGGLSIGATTADGNYPTKIVTHYSVVISAPPWSPSTIANGKIASFTANVGPVGGITPGSTTLVCALQDSGLPPGIFLSAMAIDTSTQATISLLNMSGADYTPTAPLRIDAWLH